MTVPSAMFEPPNAALNEDQRTLTVLEVLPVPTTGAVAIEAAGVKVELDWFRYLVTRFEPTDIPQAQMVGFMQSMFAEQMLKSNMLKSTAISDAGLTKQSLYEVEKSLFTRSTYDRAMESLDAVNSEIANLVHRSWGR